MILILEAWGKGSFSFSGEKNFYKMSPNHQTKPRERENRLGSMFIGRDPQRCYIRQSVLIWAGEVYSLPACAVLEGAGMHAWTQCECQWQGCCGGPNHAFSSPRKDNTMLSSISNNGGWEASLEVKSPPVQSPPISLFRERGGEEKRRVANGLRIF